MKLYAIAFNTFRESLRNKILYSVLLFVVVLVGVSAFFGAVSIGSQEKVIKTFGLFSLSFFGALITILSGVSLLNKEIKQKTIYNILSKPVKRTEFVIGKYFGLTLTVWLLTALMGLGLVGFVSAFEGRVDLLLFQGILFVFLEVAVLAAVVMFFSSITVTTTLAGIFTLATYVVGRSINYLGQFVQMSGEMHGEALKQVVLFFNLILPDLSLFNVADSIVYGQAASPSYFGCALLYAVAYSAITLTLAAIIFSYRELT